jgi:hypothetical protein
MMTVGLRNAVLSVSQYCQYHSKPVVRNHIPSKCMLETITAVKPTCVPAVSLFVSTVNATVCQHSQCHRLSAQSPPPLVTSCHQFKRILKNRALAFATTTEQPFPLPHYREIGGLSTAPPPHGTVCICNTMSFIQQTQCGRSSPFTAYITSDRACVRACVRARAPVPF